jgi:radical SAM additional 4Fe4S-binding domain
MTPKTSADLIKSYFCKCDPTPQIEIKVIPSYHCDLKCKYCYNKKFELNPNISNSDPEKIKNQIDHILGESDKLKVIIEIIGGDPLSTFNYPITEDLIQYLKETNKNIKIVVQTGEFSIKKILNIIPFIDGLSYSVDISSSPKVRNFHNLQKIGEGCKENGVDLQIQTILNILDTSEDILQFIKICELYNAGWIGLEFPQYQRYSKNDLNHQITIYLQILKSVKRFPYISIGGAIIESACDYARRNLYKSSCLCGEKSITIQPDGSLTPSLHTNLNSKFSLTTFAKIKNKRNNVLRSGICSDCQFWDVCWGGCMAHAEFLTGSYLNRDEEYCYILSNILKSM